jgi:uncharacterized protein (UPF0335 family)
MKSITLAVTVFFTLSLAAQTKKAPPAKTSQNKPTLGALTNAQANTIVDYVNHINEFLETKVYLESVQNNLNYVNEGAYSSDKNFNSLRNLQNKYKPLQEWIDEYKESNEGYVITNAPAVCGNQSKEKVNKNLSIIDVNFKQLNDLVLSTQSLIDKSNNFKVSGSYDKAIEELEKINTNYSAISNAMDTIYDELSELGYRAEEVTLDKHPMKTEIFDMKKTMKGAKDALKWMTRGEKDKIITNYPLVDAKIESLKTYRNKYGDAYKDMAKGNSYQMARAQVKAFYERLDKFFSEIGDIKKSLEGKDKQAEEDADAFQKGLITTYELLVGDYNSFVNTNNDD